MYIDPPYNTGAKDWKYDNNDVDDTVGMSTRIGPGVREAVRSFEGA